MRRILPALIYAALAYGIGWATSPWAWGAPAPGVRGGASFTPGSSITVTAASSSTVNVSWTTGSAGNTIVYCGTSPTVLTVAAVVNGTQTGVTSHTAIVAGLPAATLVYCRGTSVDGSGNATYQQGSATTLAATATTPVTAVTYGTPVDQLGTANGNGHADTWYNTISNDSIEYIQNDDTTGFGGVANSNMLFAKLTSENPVTGIVGSNINQFTGLGTSAQCVGTPALSNKLSGLLSYGGTIYALYNRQLNNTGGCTTFVGPGYQQFSGSMLHSADKGATWTNFQGTTTANGTLLTPNTASTGPTTNDWASVMFVMYGADDGNTCPGLSTPVDNCDAYMYQVNVGDGSGNSWNFFGTRLYLRRIPLTQIGSETAAKYQYFTGGDGNLDTNWSSSSSGQAAIITGTGTAGTNGTLSYVNVQYIPRLNRYILLTNYWDSFPTPSQSTWTLFEAPHPWGPWTLVDSTVWASNSLYNPVVLQRTALGGSPANMVVMSTKFPSGYNMWTIATTLKCGVSPTAC